MTPASALTNTNFLCVELTAGNPSKPSLGEGCCPTGVEAQPSLIGASPYSYLYSNTGDVTCITR